LPTITTARRAHDLTATEAERGYPIHLRGVVTNFDSDSGVGITAIFMHDASGCIFVNLNPGEIKTLPVGSVVDVRGVSDPGGFAPIVDQAHIQVVGHAALPSNPHPASRTQLFNSEFEGQWVEIEGVVHSISETGHSVLLKLEMTDGFVYATTLRRDGVHYSNLVDAKVRIDGNEAPLYNNNGQKVGAHVIFPDLTTVHVLEPAPNDPFERPVVQINELLRWDQVSAMHHRVHMRGNVTMQWPGTSLCIRDATGAICARTDQETRLAEGDVADVVGFSGTENSTPVLNDALFRKSADGVHTPATAITAEQAMQGKNNSELIQMDGELIGLDQASSDTTLMLASGKYIFAAVLPKSMAGPEIAQWQIGSKLHVTGICSVEFDAEQSALNDGIAVPLSFRILMRSPQDVVVTRKPSWWTPTHELVLLGLVVTGSLGVLAWVMMLRKRVDQQTKLLRDQTELLRESENRFRHLALHDGLTGVATRLLLQDRMGVAVESARRHQTGLAVLMLDLDRFKEINDSLGHLAGDEVLRVTAERVVGAVRKGDTVARLGGDEFIVLLPNLNDAHLAEGIAAKIVKILAVPISFEETKIPVSVSVGVCTATAGELDAEMLLKNADDALYRAKASGRNCFYVYTDATEATTSQ